jgi:hypothetical protein
MTSLLAFLASLAVHIRSFGAADGVKPFWTLNFARLESKS